MTSGNKILGKRVDIYCDQRLVGLLNKLFGSITDM